MKAAKRFKNAIAHKRPPVMDSILGEGSSIVEPPSSMFSPGKPPLHHRTKSEDMHDRKPTEQVLVSEGVHRDVGKSLQEEDLSVNPPAQTPVSKKHDPSSPTSPKRNLHAHPEEHRATQPQLIRRPTDHTGKGQAHDPLSEHLYLALGPGGSSRSPSPPTVSESPPAAEVNIYEQAYDNEIQRLRSIPGRSSSLFLTRRVESADKYRLEEDLIRGTEDERPKEKGGFAKLLEHARAANTARSGESKEDSEPPKVAPLVDAGILRKHLFRTPPDD